MTAVVRARDLAIGWSSDAVLVEDASFEVESGEIFGVLGRSGSGKSTLLRVLIGLEPPLAGDVAVLGAPPAIGDRRPRYGVMFQHGALFGSMTLGENITLALREWTDLPADAQRAIARSQLRLVGLEASIDRYPAELSGGMRKRAAIARALTLEPPLIFLDEPSSGLDPITSAELDRLILELARTLNLTIVMVTHELSSIEAIVDRCILLDRATRRIVSGTPRELAGSVDPTVAAFFHRVPREA